MIKAALFFAAAWARIQRPRRERLADIETDYLVVGAGASALGFVDALLAAHVDARVVIVDRRHAAGGHWLDAYPFVRLHQPSAVYGVMSRRLGQDRIDESGPNQGFYERATAPEICEYFGLVLEGMVASGRVSFLAQHDYRGVDTDGHLVVSLATGRPTTIRARKLVDATYIESEIPARHALPFAVDSSARVIPPNALVDLDEPPGGFTVIGAGKTAMDTVSWLLDGGVDPDRIQWIRPRDPWLYDRRSFQPLQLVGSYMEMQAGWVGSALEAVDGADFGRRLEAAGVFKRIDPAVEPEAYRGPIVSARELEQLRTVERVVRKGRVRSVGTSRIQLEQGEAPTQPDSLHVDCTAAGVRRAPPQPVFTGDRITLQYVTITGAAWSAAILGHVEAAREDDAEKNRLCPPVSFSGNAADLLALALAGMSGLAARTAESDLMAWDQNCRLNPARGAAEHLDDPQVAAALTSVLTNFGPAMRNLARRTREASPAPA